MDGVNLHCVTPRLAILLQASPCRTTKKSCHDSATRLRASRQSNGTVFVHFFTAVSASFRFAAGIFRYQQLHQSRQPATSTRFRPTNSKEKQPQHQSALTRPREARLPSEATELAAVVFTRPPLLTAAVASPRRTRPRIAPSCRCAALDSILSFIKCIYSN